MKIFGFFFTLSLFFFSCKKSINIDPEFGYHGTITGLLANGKPYNPPSGWVQYAAGRIDTIIYPCLKKKFGFIQFLVYDQNGLEENLVISNIPLQIGTFNIEESNYQTPSSGNCDTTILYSSMYLYDGGDAILGEYTLLKSAKSVITISSYDIVSGDVVGTFDVTLAKDFKFAAYSNFLDTMRFSGGIFKTKWLIK